MATLRQDLLRSTYQDQQLKAILSINTYMKDLDARTSSLSGYVTRNGITADIDAMFDHLADVIRGTGLRSDASNSRSYERVVKAVRDSSKRDQQSRTNDDRSTRDEERRRIRINEEEYELQRQAAAEIVHTVSQIHRTIQSFMSDLGISIDQMITRSTRLIESSNTMIFNTGYTYATVQQYRDYLRGTVDDLNSRYDRAQFDYNDSLDLINTIINQTGIKDLDFYETYGELFLKTSKSMNIHLGSLAEFSDKFYKRYNFSSMNMEEMLTSIRENTAGTSLTDEQVRDFLMSNQTTFAQYADQIVRTQGGDFNTILTGINDSFAESIAYLNKLGLDNSQINTVMDTLMKASTDRSGAEAVELLQVGIDGSDLDRFMSDPLSVVEEYVQGAARLGGSLASNFGLSSTYASAAGLKNDELYRQLYLTSKYGNFITAEESTEDNPEIAEDPLQERYVTVQEHISNKTSTIADTLADIQERLGIDLPFIQSILDFLKNIFSTVAGVGFSQFMLQTFLGGSSGGGLLGKLGGLLGTAGGSGSGLLSTAGPIAVGIAAVVAGVKGINDGLAAADERFASVSSKTDAENLPTLGEGQVYDWGVTGYSVDDEGNVQEQYGVVARDGDFDFRSVERSIAETIVAEYNEGKLPSQQLMITEGDDGLPYVSFRANSQYGDVGFLQALGETALDTLGLGFIAGGKLQVPVYGAVKNVSEGSGTIDSLWDQSSNNAAIMGRLSYSPDSSSLYAYYQQTGLIPINSEEATELKAYFAILWDQLLELAKDDKVVNLKKLADDTDYIETVESINAGVSPDLSAYIMDSSLLDARNPFVQHDGEESTDYSSYDVGTTYVPEDQLAYIHQGEAIIPESQNPFNNPEIWSPEIYVEVTPIVESTPTVSNMMDTSTYDQQGFDDIVAVQRESSNREESQLSILIEYTQKIFDFINYWKDDYETREDLRMSRENVKSIGQSPMTSTAFG